MEVTLVHILILNFAFCLFWNTSAEVLVAKDVRDTIL